MKDDNNSFYKTATEATGFPPKAKPKLMNDVKIPPLPDEAPKRKKGIYIGAPACFALELACRHVNEAFGEDSFGTYIVGSVLERSDWRDVDVRMILSDDGFQKLFPDADVAAESWEFDPRWLLLTVTISKFISDATSLPIDFQFQPQSHANKRHSKTRSAVGLRLSKRAAIAESNQIAPAH